MVPDAKKKGLDALLLAADCQNRAQPLVHLYERVTSELTAEELVDLVTSGREYLAMVEKDVKPTKIKTVEDVIGKSPRPAKLNGLLQRIKQIVGNEDYQFVGRCYSNTINASFFHDELGSLTSWLSDTVYRVDTVPSLGEKPQLKDRVDELRADLAKRGIQYMYSSIFKTTSEEFDNTPCQDRQKPWDSFWDQIAAALDITGSRIKKPDGMDVPLIDFHLAMLASLRDAYSNGHTIISTEDQGDDEVEDNESIEDSEGAAKRCTCKLTTSRVPDEKTGNFCLLRQVPEGMKDKPYLTIDMPSYYVKGQAGSKIANTLAVEYGLVDNSTAGEEP
ncbi:hypothetical protein C0995_009690 [Termitomyces sp. Mi166|nr:hypothetical protein C0995_009690 [Termitomyces sp. Mi166\